VLKGLFTLIAVFCILVSKIPNIIAVYVPEDAREITDFFAQGMSGWLVYGVLQQIAEHVNLVYGYLDKGLVGVFFAIAGLFFYFESFIGWRLLQRKLSLA
jgi:hypothetical protein